MAERVFQDYFGLLIPLLTALLFIVYVKRNRVSMLKSVLFGHFSKVHFKSVSQTTNEKEMTILFWSAIFLQGIYVHSFFIENSTFQNKGSGEMPSSRLDSHRNSVQFGMVERFTAFTATIFVPNFSFHVAANFCPLYGNCKNEQKTKKLRKAGQDWAH